MITVRKIKLTIIGDKDTRNSKYKWIRDEQYNQYRALNMGMTYLALNDILYMNESGLEIRTIKDLKDCEKEIDKNKKEIERLIKRLDKEENKKNSSPEKLDEIKHKISLVENKDEEYKVKKVELNKTLKETQKERMDIQKEFKEKYVDDLYQVLDKIPFKHLDNKSLVNQKIKADIKADKSNGLLKGERSIRNYKRNFPLMTRGRDLKFKYGDNDDIEMKWIEGIKFKVIFGNRMKNSLELRHTLHKVIDSEYKICDSSLQFDKNNNLILNLTLDIPIDIVKKKVIGRVVGVDLGLKIPAYCALNDVEYIKKSIGRIDDFLKVRTQMQNRRRRLQISVQSAKGGKGRVDKLQALERFAEKEKNFAKTYNHFLSSNIIKFAVTNQAEQINMELLSLKETQNKSILRNWSYYQLQTMIEYKAQREGIKVKYIDPYHTSQMCSKCGNYEEGQRESQAHFICKKCGYKVNADYNAARNIAISNKYITKKDESEYYKIKESMV